MHLNKTDVIDLDAFEETCKDCIIERQEKEIERLKDELLVHQWQPINTAPKDGSIILISDGNNVSSAKWHEDKGQILIADKIPYWEDYDFSYWDSFGDEYIDPTQWKLVLPPTAPQEG